MAKEKTKIIKFIEEISSKNYARAHKYLKSVIEDKIAKRINNATDKPLF
jgi:predicted AAA+ superfamily ATPase